MGGCILGTGLCTLAWCSKQCTRGPTSDCSAIGCGVGAGPALSRCQCSLNTPSWSGPDYTCSSPMSTVRRAPEPASPLSESLPLSLFTIHVLAPYIICPLGIKIQGVTVLVIPDVRGLHSCPGTPSWVPYCQLLAVNLQPSTLS